LVLGTAWGYSVEQMRPFVESMRSHYDGAAAVIVEGSDAALADYLTRRGVDTVRPEQDLGIPAPFGRALHIDRYAYYVAYLARRSPMPSSVLLTDVRDVIIQGNPFAEAGANGLDFFLEQDALIGDQATRQWFIDAFGPAVAAAIGDRPGICGGTIIGSGAAIQQLCRLVLFLAAIPRRGVARSFGIDQAAVNVAAYFGLVEAEIHPNFGHVATLGLVDPDIPSLDQAGFILGPAGNRSPVVHQYDYHPALVEAVRQKYGGVATPNGRDSGSLVANTVSRVKAGLRRRVPELR
jgi:hypothetical protein